jgi:hypothetical protein
MIEQSLILKRSSPDNAENPTSRLRQEYLVYQRFFQAQTGLVQQYLNIQAALVVDALDQRASHVRFTLPDAVICSRRTASQELSIPRQAAVGGWADGPHSPHGPVRLLARLTELENNYPAVSTGQVSFAMPSTIWFTTCLQVVGVLQNPQSNVFNQPVERSLTWNHHCLSDDFQPWRASGGRDLTVLISIARRFYLPQWVAFDDHGRLLLNTLVEASAVISSMQHFLAILQSAVRIAPYMIADDIWQQKRYGMLGQLVNQGRASAYFQAQEMIRTIKDRASTNRLNRGLRLSLPYFNDQTLQLEESHFEVIPAGRVMFIPAFVVLAVRVQGTKVAHDTRLSPSTRRHLLFILSMFERSFLR